KVKVAQSRRKPDPDVPTHPSMQAVYRCPCGLELLAHPSPIMVKKSTRMSEFDTPSGAQQQMRTHARLHRLEAARDVRARHAQAACRLGERALLHHADEKADQVQIQ